MEIGARQFGGVVPIVVGAPHLGRYVVFGNLFAVAGGDEVFRIDRHPTMARHPVTPMHEADLRRHLAAQTDMPIALVPIDRSEEHTSELQSLMRISYAVFCLKQKTTTHEHKRQVYVHPR